MVHKVWSCSSMYTTVHKDLWQFTTCTFLHVHLAFILCHNLAHVNFRPFQIHHPLKTSHLVPNPFHKGLVSIILWFRQHNKSETIIAINLPFSIMVSNMQWNIQNF